MPFPEIDPIALQIGPIAVRWYALAYVFGVLLGCGYAYALLRRRELWKDSKPPLQPADAWDAAFYVVLAIVVGGRLGYVLFYNLPHYIANPGEIFAVWDGGMSFHGGLIGLMLAIGLFVRSKGGSLLSAMDILGAVSPIGLFLGRVANFINSELYGAATTLPWGVVFPTDPEQLPRHPSQLYEALLEGLVLFVIIFIATHRFHALRRPGLVAGIFGVGYAFSRIAVEFVRLPDVQVGYLYGGWLTLGMVLTLGVLALGIFFVAMGLRQSRA